MNGDALHMWVVYENPADYAGKHVVRVHRVAGGALQVAREPHFVGDTLAEARASIPPGLTCLTREYEDDPVIVEVWL